MHLEPDSPSSIETISLKFIQSNPQSSSLIKLSQDRISLNYTVSLSNISTSRLQSPQIEVIEEKSVQFHTKTLDSPNNNKLFQKYPKQIDQATQFKKDVFKKKSILKVSNLNVHADINRTIRYQEKEPFKPKKSFMKVYNSILLNKTKHLQDPTLQTKKNTKAKQSLNFQFLDFLEGTQTRTKRFYSSKNDKVVDQAGTRQNTFSIKQQIVGKIQPFQTDRKLNKFPIIKGVNSHFSSPASLNKKRKIFSCHENAQHYQRNLLKKNDKIVLGKSCKIKENDEKTKKYLQKVIQNRNSIIHFSQNKSIRFLKEGKQNL